MLSRFAVSCGRQGLGLTRQSVNIVKNNGQPHSSLRAMVSRIQSTLAAEAGATLGAQAQSASGTVSRTVGWWLAGCAGMCVGAVVLGGVTRLTESGLSMTDWNLAGRPPPMSTEEWLEEFEKYKLSPEFKWKNFDISLEDFKFIWYMEYIHRMWGRTIGAAFYIPATVFWMRGMLTPALKKRVMLMGGLLGFQGLLGWYMVKSGLEHDNFLGPNDVPRVSQYRLAAHLSSAVVLYSVLFWNAKEILAPAFRMTPEKVTPALAQLRKMVISSKALVFLTLVSGAFVAGLDAGLVYNSFPKFADRWIPEDLLLFSPLLRNITENPTCVQFDHRVLGILSLSLITATAAKALRTPGLPPHIRTAALVLGAAGWMQVCLGITTLLLYVPVPVAALHQSGALATLSVAMWTAHDMKFMKILSKIPK